MALLKSSSKDKLNVMIQKADKPNISHFQVETSSLVIPHKLQH